MVGRTVIYSGQVQECAQASVLGQEMPGVCLMMSSVSLFQSEFSRECNLVLLLSMSTIFSFF